LLSILLAITTLVVKAQDLDWVKIIPGQTVANEYCSDMQLDALGNIFVAGWYDGPVDFDPGLGTQIHTPVGTQDPVVLKLDSSGNYLNVMTLPDPNTAVHYMKLYSTRS
jgi:hypothetical protein